MHVAAEDRWAAGGVGAAGEAARDAQPQGLREEAQRGPARAHPHPPPHQEEVRAMYMYIYRFMVFISFKILGCSDKGSHD